MWRVRPLGFLVGVAATAALGIAYFTNTAIADDSDRSIPTIEVSSPSPGEINVIWGTPSETDTLNSYRVSWALWEKNGLTSYKDANSDTGGNAYPDAPGVFVHDNGSGARGVRGLRPRQVRRLSERGLSKSRPRWWWWSDSAEKKEATPPPQLRQDDPQEPVLRPGEITGLTLTSSRLGHLWVLLGRGRSRADQVPA